MQTSGLITYFPSFSLIASTGQEPAQEPQPMQSSPITYAIFSTSILNLYLKCSGYTRIIPQNDRLCKINFRNSHEFNNFSLFERL